MKATPMKDPALHKGVVYALLAAALFGASTPFAKTLVGQVAPVALAGLLYLGSGIGLLACYLARAQVQRGGQGKPVTLTAPCLGGRWRSSAPACAVGNRQQPDAQGIGQRSPSDRGNQGSCGRDRQTNKGRYERIVCISVALLKAVINSQKRNVMASTLPVFFQRTIKQQGPSGPS